MPKTSSNDRLPIGALVVFAIVSTLAMTVTGWIAGNNFGPFGPPGCTVGLEEFCGNLYGPIIGGIGLILAIVFGLTLKRTAALITMAAIVVGILALSLVLPLVLFTRIR